MRSAAETKEKSKNICFLRGKELLGPFLSHSHDPVPHTIPESTGATRGSNPRLLSSLFSLNCYWPLLKQHKYKMMLLFFRSFMISFHIRWIIFIAKFYGSDWTEYMSYLCIAFNLAYFIYVSSSQTLAICFPRENGSTSLGKHKNESNYFKNVVVSITITIDVLVCILYWGFVHRNAVSFQKSSIVHILASVLGHTFNLIIPLADVYFDSLVFGHQPLQHHMVLYPVFVLGVYGGWMTYQSASIYHSYKPLPYEFMESLLRIVDGEEQGLHLDRLFAFSCSMTLGTVISFYVSFYIIRWMEPLSKQSSSLKVSAKIE
jgi:hypothetical protein